MQGGSFGRRLERQLRGVRNQIAAQENEATAEQKQSRHAPSFENRIVSTPANGAGSSEAPQADKPKGEAGHTASETALVKATQRLRDFTLALVLVSLVSAVISYLQWQEIHDQSSDTHALAEAAVTQAKAAADSAKIARDSLIANSRAWVGAFSAGIDPLIADTPIIYHVSYSNSGHEPARLLAFDTHAHTIFKEGLEKDFGWAIINGNVSTCFEKKRKCWWCGISFRQLYY